MIRIDAVWLAVQPMDMRAGASRNLFANARHTRIKRLVHDGFGVWCAARRLNIVGFAFIDGLRSIELVFE